MHAGFALQRDGAAEQEFGGAAAPARGAAGGLYRVVRQAARESGKQVRVQAFYTDNGGVAEAPVSDALSVADLPDPRTDQRNPSRITVTLSQLARM